jgi:hypothetical protein
MYQSPTGSVGDQKRPSRGLEHHSAASATATRRRRFRLKIESTSLQSEDLV